MSPLGRSTRNLLTLVLAAGLTITAPTPVTAAPDDGARGWPHRINLPNGFRPEGIAIGRRPFAYLGSLADGDIYRANLRTGGGRVIHQGVAGSQAVGLKLGPKGRLWVAGGAGGSAKVVSTRTGRVLANYDFTAGTTGGSFVNDVVLRRGAAWFTDSQRPVLYKVSRVGRPARARFRTVPLSGAWSQVEGEFNANGISTTPDGRALLVVQSFTGKLFRVHPGTGRASLVGLGGYELTNGDGMLRRGRTLYVAQNFDNKVAVLRLAKHGRFGRLVGTLRSPGFDVPTTIARFRSALYLPNARFGTTPTPATRYWITRVRP